MDSSRTYPVFSYGSNSIFQLRGRVNNSSLLSYPGYVDGYKRIFCNYSKKWKGGVASIIKKRYIRTYGIIVYLNEEELKILDGYEQNYSKIDIECTILNNNKEDLQKIQCIAYQSNSHEWINYPSQQYLVAIKIMLDEHNLYQQYCPKLIIAKYNNYLNRTENLVKWKFPNKELLELSSFFVLANSLRIIPWKMPRDLNNIEERMHKLHISTIDELEKYLNDDFYIKMLGFKANTLLIFRKILENI
jgi:cation transport regulator ChaC